MKIFITGCRKSGTNLLLLMFWAFSDVHVFPMETSLNKLIAEVPPLETSILVDKMCEYHLMGVLCTGKQPDRQLQAALDQL